ncbi:protein of unknown function [Taphrina deformans PYCC 5710]|uniref:J domain-containing protein n=1 Tax=Taphrina deformans (strain PYCC 5710 / ATCC 11124 / CBS 356.35 / IMI 108563 / JCM 9778 / NBRC 8474) TaxID=1097556 RepID=R4XGQ8_TAPDE|nr:protein of unknown function [Taphrina deformans PYCC 5710]|eukprot:CCG84854.1 protein of unknown function [Taphrina deformans PYCC 5710]
MVKPELDSTKDYYRVLGIPATSTQVDIRKAYLDLARTQHPDKNPGHEIVFKAKFQYITTAYDVLKDPALKRAYDQIRPNVRKEVPRSTVNSVPKSATNNNSGTKSSTGASTRPPAVPRQAKNATKATPKSPPKKAPTARKDPLNGWTPPVPQSKTASGFSNSKSKTSTHTYYSDATSTKSPNAAASKAPSAARSAFYNASPSSPYSAYNSNNKNSFVPTSSKSTKTQPDIQPDWTAKENLWAKSNTAYSTFHEPTSRYSPYAADKSEVFSASSVAKEPRSNMSPGNIFAFRGVKTPTPPSLKNPAGSGIFSTGSRKSTAEYEWQHSRSAYQGRPTPAKDAEQSAKVPRKNPFGSDIKAGNPFFEPQSRPRTLDAEAMGDFGVDSGQRNRQADPMRNSIDSSKDNSSTSKDGLPVQTTDNKHAKSRPNATLTDPDETKPSATQPDSPRTNEHDKKPFLFDFKPSPAQLRTSSSRRTSAGIPPYVKFNPVPDLNFSSPASKADNDEYRSSLFNCKANIVNDDESFAQADPAKKHARGDDAQDPRFPHGTPNEEKSDEDKSDEDKSEDLSAKFSSFGIGKSSSPQKTPLRDELKSERSRVRRRTRSVNKDKMTASPIFTAGTECQGIFTFSTPGALKPTLPRDSTSSPATGKWSFNFTNAPIPAVELLRPLDLADLAGDQVIGMYRASCRLFSSYLTAWSSYEQPNGGDNPQPSITDPSYLAALSRHQQVLESQAERIGQYVTYIRQEYPSTKSSTHEPNT